MEKIINHGVIPGKKSDTLLAGAILWENRNPSGDWTPFLVRPEKQAFQTFDTMACVSFATNNVMEMQIKQQTGIEVNFSDRFLAKMSGTTIQGNWVYIVLDTWRNIGVVREEEWPAPPEPTTFDAYYASIPQFIKDRALGQSVLKYGKPVYEYLADHAPDVVRHHLQHAPLLITIPGHEVAGVVLDINGYDLTILDTYPFSPNYTRKINLRDVTDIYKAVITVPKGDAMNLVKDPTGTYRLVGEKGSLGIADIESLALLKQLTDAEQIGTPTVPQVGIIEKGFTIHK